MAKMLKTIVAGPLVLQTIYPVISVNDTDGVRAGKRNLSSEAQKRMNLKYACQRLELEMAANFRQGDIVATLTYDADHLPRSRREAMRRAQRFWRKLRAKRGISADLCYIYVTEHKHGDGRWHHHALINSTGDDYAMILSAWGYGTVDMHPFCLDRDKNFETLARYFCKEQRDFVGQRLWSCSRNLRKPEPDSQRVPNDTELTVPEGATVLMDTGDVRTAYGHYRFIKYLAKGWAAESSPRAKRRRRHKRKPPQP